MRIQDKAAIVTGGGSGIGQGICYRLAEEGGVIAVLDIDFEAAQNTAREIEKAGGRALAIKADVAIAAEVDATVKEVISAFGKIDILVNNAGVSLSTSVAKMSEEVWDKTIDVNLKSVFLCSRAVIPYMKKRRYGKILNISSILGLTGSPAMVHYYRSRYYRYPHAGAGDGRWTARASSRGCAAAPPRCPPRHSQRRPFPGQR
jgi:NAD(P)-dependent dehydrogenase (short-subunit alcohol dehydrogenase family)